MNSALLTRSPFFDQAALFRAVTLSRWKIKIAFFDAVRFIRKINIHECGLEVYSCCVHTVVIIDLHTVWIYRSLAKVCFTGLFSLPVGNGRRFFLASTSADQGHWLTLPISQQLSKSIHMYTQYPLTYYALLLTYIHTPKLINGIGWSVPYKQRFNWLLDLNIHEVSGDTPTESL